MHSLMREEVQADSVFVSACMLVRVSECVLCMVIQPGGGRQQCLNSFCD